MVGLGFGMNLAQVVHAGSSGFLYTAISITVATGLGLLLGWWFGVTKKASFLITMGTAICGGSAIAALAPVTHADDDEIAVSMGTVFALNSVALLLFPFVGHRLNLTQTQFGLWAALAIHDTSSVVGAAAKYGSQALAIGTTVKLARALWIVPVSMITAFAVKSKARIQWPLVHPVFLSRRGAEQLPACDASRIRSAEQARQNGTNRHALSHRHGSVEADFQACRCAPDAAGRPVVDCDRDRITAAIRAGWIAL